MAPQHRDMSDRNRVHVVEHDEPSFSPFDEGESAFNPFDTSGDFDYDFGDSFGNDFGGVSFPDGSEKSSEKPPKTRSPGPSGRKMRRRRDSVSVRMDDSSKRLNDSSKRLNDSSKRLNDSSRRLNDGSHRGIDGSSRLDDSSRRMGDSSRRRRSTAPSGAVSFPKNGTRRGSTMGKQERPKRSSAPAGASRAEGTARASNPRSRSRRSLLDESNHANDTPLSPGRRTSVARGNGERRSPRAKRESIVSKRDATGSSDARCRIRKEAALQRGREERKRQEAKLENQKAKLAKQKNHTNYMLGRKLAKLDVKNGKKDIHQDGAEEPDSRRGAELNSSMHSNNSSSMHGKQRRRRRTQLSHNILVRNMNQMTAPRAEDDEEEDDTEYNDEEDFEGEEWGSSSADSIAKKEAWQRRLERQRL